MCNETHSFRLTEFHFSTADIVIDLEQPFEILTLIAGFLTAGHRDLHGNYGLDDQIEAIRWLKTNARNIDGDPNNIVVAGMGAGAACASILAVSPKTKGNLETP